MENINHISSGKVNNDPVMFLSWLKQSHTVFISSISIGVSLFANAGLIIERFHSISSEPSQEILKILMFINVILQFIFLFFIYFFYSSKDKKFRIKTDRAELYIRRLTGNSAKQPSREELKMDARLNLLVFSNYWRGFWASMFCLYFVFIIDFIFKIWNIVIAKSNVLAQESLIS